MIKINLLKEKRPRRIEVPSTKIALKEIKIGELLKLGGKEYLLSIPLWLGIVGVGVWYWRISTQLTKVKREIDQLQVEKSMLSERVRKITEEKKKIESEIANLNNEIALIERSKDILVGLKSLYIPFNDGFRSFSSSIPSTGWLVRYSQTLDLENRKLKTELELNSYDYASIGIYAGVLRKTSSEVFVSNIERKTNPSGYEYYFAKLNAEKNIGGK